jgi:hypothetical protein
MYGNKWVLTLGRYLEAGANRAERPKSHFNFSFLSSLPFAYKLLSRLS